MNRFRQMALAASDQYWTEDDVGLVARVLEIDELQRDFNEKLNAVMQKHAGDRKYLARCRKAGRERSTAMALQKRDLLLLWEPGVVREAGPT